MSVSQHNAFGQRIPPLDEALAEAAELRRRINREFGRVLELHDKRGSLKLAKLGLRDLVLRDYLHALNRLKIIDRETLTAERDTLEARLEKGWGMEDDPKPDRWITLLMEYETLCDALAPSAIGGYLDRLRMIEGLPAPPAPAAGRGLAT